MTLRAKILAVVLVVFVVLASVLFFISRTVLLDGYRALEHQDMKQHITRVLLSIKNEGEVLDTTVFDWAAWDDAYAFVAGQNPLFIESNLGDATFNETGLKLNFVLFIDSDGQIVFEKGYDWKNDLSIDFPRDLVGHLTKQGLLKLPTETSAVIGFVRLIEGIFLLASRPILTSDKGGPSRGALVMGRRFDQRELTRLAEKLQLNLDMQNMGVVDLSADFKDAFLHLSKQVPLQIQEMEDGRVGGYTQVLDIYGNAIAILRVAQTRNIYNQGVSAGNYLMAVVTGVSLIFGVLLVFVLEKWVLSRLTKMNRRVAQIGGRESPFAGLPVEGKDELANFARALNEMLERVKTTEQELVRLERLSALGELAAGINHNLNNILVGVTVSSEFLLEDVQDPEIREHVEVIFRAGRQAADLVARLQDAMLGESEEGALRSINEVIREAVEAAKPRWKDEAELKGYEIAVELDLAHDLSAIRGSSSGLYNVMLNLLFNAVDALPDGGSIEVRSIVVAEGVQLSVRDTGVGMNEETAKRVFDPFFTTKVQIGTGLGLSTVYNTVVGWGGKIDVDSVLGAGTVFTIWLPSVEAGLESSLAVSELEAIESGRVLVVDDQDIVTELVYDILAPTHEVISTHSGEIALGLLDGEDFDVVMLDLGMPGVPGDQVAQKIRDTAPDIALILMTGWRLRDDDARLDLFDFHLRKPLSNLGRVRDVVRRAVRLRRARRKESN